MSDQHFKAFTHAVTSYGINPSQDNYNRVLKAREAIEIPSLQQAFYAGQRSGWNAARRPDLANEPIIPAATQYLDWRDYEDARANTTHSERFTTCERAVERGDLSRGPGGALGQGRGVASAQYTEGAPRADEARRPLLHFVIRNWADRLEAAVDPETARAGFAAVVREMRDANHRLWSEDAVLMMLSNSGIDIECGACMEVAFTGVTTNQHTCSQHPILDQINELRATNARIAAYNTVAKAQRSDALAALRDLWFWATDRANDNDRGEFVPDGLGAKVLAVLNDPQEK